jgi:hypothetical protein
VMNSRNIPAVDEAIKLRDRVAREFENMSYEQLQELSATLERAVDGWTTLRREELPSGGLNVNVEALICQWGLVRHRISVELTVYSDDGSIHSGVVPCVYFERFASGRIFKPGARGTVVIIGLWLALLAVVLLLWLYVNRGE